MEYLTFDEALQSLANEATLLSPVLYSLSSPSSGEAQRFGRYSARIPVERRRKIVASLVENAEANFELDYNALFRQTMKDEDAEVRATSIEGLWEDEEVTLIAPLVHMLRYDAAPSVRAAAATSLGRFMLLAELEELEESYANLISSALLNAIRNADEILEVRCRAVESIAYWTHECVHDIIARAYQDRDESMRLSAVFAMGRSVDAVWGEATRKELNSTNPAMRYEAARACGELEVREAVPNLIHLAEGKDREVQSAAIVALGQIGGKQAQHALERYCRSDDEVVRVAAEDALSELKLGQESLDLLAYDAGTHSEANEDEDLDED